MGVIKAVCTSDIKGIQKTEQAVIELRPNWGIEGDAHAAPWHRQVSLLPYEQIEAFKNRGAVYHQMGDCIMPREGVFCKVIAGGTIAPGDLIEIA